MHRRQSSPWTKALGAALGLAALLQGCSSGQGHGPEEKVVNIYNWPNGIDPDTIKLFERETGIKVRYGIFDSSEVLQAKMLAGNSGYDVVVPSGPFLQRMLQGGLFQPLKREAIPNLRNLDPLLMRKVAVYDPGARYSVPYVWTTIGVGYNIEKVKARMPDAPIDSLDMVFKPEVAARFEDCGITWIDAPAEILPLALGYLGLDPNSDRPTDLDRARRLVHAVRPYIRYINSAKYMDDLANGETCVVLGWSGDILLAKTKAEQSARDAGIKPTPISYSIPREGTSASFDMMAIPADAPHPENAHRFLDFILRAQTQARIANVMTFANANAASWPLIRPEIRDNPQIFPPPEQRNALWVVRAASPALDRMRTDIWASMIAGSAP
jgi:putrescine transport system substrate-binding protein